MDAAMRGDPDNTSADITPDQAEADIVATIQHAHQLARPDIEAHVQHASHSSTDSHKQAGGTRIAAKALDDTVIGPQFFRNAVQDGVVLLELCAGICSTLEMLLRAGIKVHKYLYTDKDPKARQAAGLG
jgi:hypothetical protein